MAESQSAVKAEAVSPANAANADDPEIEEDADIDMNIDPSATEKPAAETEMEEDLIEEPKEPTKKDVSLRDFLGKMDDYAPIVSPLKSSTETLLSTSYSAMRTVTIRTKSFSLIDSRRSHITSPPSRRLKSSKYSPSTLSTARTSDSKVHRRYCSRRISILPHALIHIIYCCSSSRWTRTRWARRNVRSAGGQED